VTTLLASVSPLAASRRRSPNHGAKPQAANPNDMDTPRLNLVVLRVADIERSVAFYRLMGLEFVRHVHGAGLPHYACEMPGLVFELYPATPEQPVTTSARIGFAVGDVDVVFKQMTEAGATVISAPKDSQWGRRAVIADLDGHRIELT